VGGTVGVKRMSIVISTPPKHMEVSKESKMKEEEEPKHSPIGASICHRWWECPGSVALSAKIPEQESSFPADEGTGAHELGEKVLKARKLGKMATPYDFMGETVMVNDTEIEFTEEMCDAVEQYIKVINTECSRFGTGYNFLSIEQPFNLNVDPEAWGTNDASLYKPFDFLHIWDYKHGKGTVVEVENNKQLMYYALGALKGKGDVERVITTIVQPRAYHPDGPIRTCEYTLGQLHTFEEMLKEKIADTKDPKAPLKSGKHCKFCPAIGDCPEVRAETQIVAKEDFKAVQLNTTDNMIKLLEMTPRIIDFLKANAKELRTKAERGEKLSGFKLVKAKSNRIWKSETRVVSQFGAKLGDKMYEPGKMLSPAKMEKMAKGILAPDDLLPFIDKPDKGLTLVAESDPRKAFDGTSAKEAFIDV
jgi:hypothetical protein